MNASTRTFKLADIFLLTAIVAMILAFFSRHPIPASIVTLAIVGVAGVFLGNQRLIAALLRHRYRVMFFVAAAYLLPWLCLAVGF